MSESKRALEDYIANLEADLEKIRSDYMFLSQHYHKKLQDARDGCKRLREEVAEYRKFKALLLEVLR